MIGDSRMMLCYILEEKHAELVYYRDRTPWSRMFVTKDLMRNGDWRVQVKGLAGNLIKADRTRGRRPPATQDDASMRDHAPTIIDETGPLVLYNRVDLVWSSRGMIPPL